MRNKDIGFWSSIQSFYLGSVWACPCLSAVGLLLCFVDALLSVRFLGMVLRFLFLPRCEWGGEVYDNGKEVPFWGESVEVARCLLVCIYVYGLEFISFSTWHPVDLKFPPLRVDDKSPIIITYIYSNRTRFAYFPGGNFPSSIS